MKISRQELLEIIKEELQLVKEGINTVRKGQRARYLNSLNGSTDDTTTDQIEIGPIIDFLLEKIPEQELTNLIKDLNDPKYRFYGPGPASVYYFIKEKHPNLLAKYPDIIKQLEKR